MNKYVSHFSVFDNEMKMSIHEGNDELSVIFSVAKNVYGEFDEEERKDIQSLDEFYQACFDRDCMMGIIKI